MLGWMLGRGDHALDAVEDGDTTQIDQPDTPAPVFAARAFKSALFGTPAQTDASRSRARARAEPVAADLDGYFGTPMKPPGILLTPGTGTNRRKRVSFNHDALTTTKSISPLENTKDSTEKRRLPDLFEKAKKRKGIGNTGLKADAPKTKIKTDTDSEWEEEEDVCASDITLDLNEPHSQSGKYWKGEFERYRKEAGAEMEKLVKYKQRAKSYAREKDMEAMQLAEKLREEQERVIAMEKKIAEKAVQMAARQRDPCSTESAEFLATLTKQTALAAQYRHRVQELEGQLEELLRGREDDDGKGRKRRAAAPSPTTQRTLLDTQRELRRARGQLKELDALRGQVSSLKTQLKRAGREDRDESSVVQDLEAQLKRAKEECARKDEELGQLKSDLEAFRGESEAHDADAKAVLERAHAKISDLKKEVRSLRAANAEQAASKRDDGLNQDDVSVEVPAKVGQSRRSIDDRPEVLSQTLREKYQKDNGARTATADVLADRVNMDKPRWQPFVPRSPRNRIYTDENLAKRVQTGATKPSKFAVPDLPALAKSMARSRRSGSVDGDKEVDLLQDRFARLGGEDGGNNKESQGTGKVVLSANVRSSLPPERRAAALARIEKRMAEKRAQRGYDKENVRP